MKSIKKTIAIAIAFVIFASGVTSTVIKANEVQPRAAMVGSNSKNFTYNSNSGNLSIMSNVVNSTGQYKGDIYFSVKRKLFVRTYGYYYNTNGIPTAYYEDSDSGDTKTTTLTSSWYIPTNCGKLCDSSHQCYAWGKVAGNGIGKVYFPAN